MSAPPIFFSDYFGVARDKVESYGAFDLNLLADVPLFVDPFLLFNSSRPEYQELHRDILNYLRFLKSIAGDDLDRGTILDLFRFQEVKQNWFGYCELGNEGHGLGEEFARDLRDSLGRILSADGENVGTKSDHLEKVSLLRSGVGLDNISDFATNLIKHYLLDFTETFAKEQLDRAVCASIGVERARFNFDTQTWATETRYLPVFDGQFVLLTPTDMLVHDETWINHSDMVKRYPEIVAAVDDNVQRSKISRYFEQQLGKDPTPKTTAAARVSTLRTFPELLDLYIRLKEEDGSSATAVSEAELAHLQEVFVNFFADFVNGFWALPEMEGRPKTTSFDEAIYRANVFKKWVEDKDGYLSLNTASGTASEKDVQRLIFLTLQASRFDVNREVNNGRGPVDFKVSQGSNDSCLIEVKMASNSALKRNLERQVEVYKRANETRNAVKIIVFYSEAEEEKVSRILKSLELDDSESIVLVDARADNKPSGSKA
ncbi:MAG TPA: hypothetical protein VHZ81_15820 [Galbitalea sp.]|nr:hypothetical protein [Galbitalea sp.]